MLTCRVLEQEKFILDVQCRKVALANLQRSTEVMNDVTVRGKCRHESIHQVALGLC